MEAEWLKAKHLGNLGGLVAEGQKVLGLGAHGRPYRVEADDEAWAQVMPRENNLEERLAKGGHGVPLSGMSIALGRDQGLTPRLHECAVLCSHHDWKPSSGVQGGA